MIAILDATVVILPAVFIAMFIPAGILVVVALPVILVAISIVQMPALVGRLLVCQSAVGA